MLIDSSDSVFSQWSRNNIFFTGFWCWAIAQTIKVTRGIIREKRFNFKWFAGSGGMPSSHASLAAGLTTSIGLYYGFDSGLFAMAFGFAVITMFDAQGVRHQSGKQAGILNKIVEDLYAHKGLQQARLKELFGHTPKEVFAGAVLGVAIAIALYK